MEYKARCGKSTNENGTLLTASSVKAHEKNCHECIHLKREVMEWANAIVVVRDDYSLEKRSNAIKVLIRKFGISTMNAQRAINAAYQRKVRKMTLEAAQRTRDDDQR